MIQIDADMPEYCNSNECLLYRFNGRIFYCTRKDGFHPVGDISNQWNKPPKDCPLKEVKHGHWIEYPECLAYAGALDSNYIVCSECGAPFNIMENDAERFDFCPVCGADMRGKTDGNRGDL